MQILDEMDPQAKEMLIEAVQSAQTGEELIRSIFVGSCPNCESENTGGCEDDREFENPLVAAAWTATVVRSAAESSTCPP